MEEIRKMNIKEIYKLIDQVIDGSDNKRDYQYIYLHLNEALAKEINYDDIVLICETIIKIAKTKNRRIRHLEKDFWNVIIRIPIKIFLRQNSNIEESEELLSNTDYDNNGKKILSRLLGMTQEILEMKGDKSKGSELRRSSALSFIGELTNHYRIPFAKPLFVKSINSKNVKEQYAALEGLENYFITSDEAIEADLIENIKSIKDNTEEREVASICLQIQINAGLIDEMTALFQMDDWKDDHYGY